MTWEPLLAPEPMRRGAPVLLLIFLSHSAEKVAQGSVAATLCKSERLTSTETLRSNSHAETDDG